MSCLIPSRLPVTRKVPTQVAKYQYLVRTLSCSILIVLLLQYLPRYLVYMYTTGQPYKYGTTRYCIIAPLIGPIPLYTHLGCWGTP